MKKTSKRFYCTCKMDFCDEGDIAFCHLGQDDCKSQFDETEKPDDMSSGDFQETCRFLVAWRREWCHEVSQGVRR